MAAPLLPFPPPSPFTFFTLTLALAHIHTLTLTLGVVQELDFRHEARNAETFKKSLDFLG